ncbi:hypothetical protein CLOM_g1252 [Closterium sp. NIES-68]|nr:hypothetical protein CLOM_g1252 [Closterium sp. NIES-68]GJP80802.1 hypothetical protein CLOP_g11001 [Closterium sp. NIES-67]
MLELSKDDAAVSGQKQVAEVSSSVDSGPGVSTAVAESLTKRDEEWKKEVAKLLAETNRLKLSKDQTIRTLRHRVEEERERNKKLKQRFFNLTGEKPDLIPLDSDEDKSIPYAAAIRPGENGRCQSSADGTDAPLSQAEPQPVVNSTTSKSLHEVCSDAEIITTLQQQLSSLQSVEQKLSSELGSLRSALSSEQQRMRLVEQQRDEALEGAREAEVALGMAERKLQEQHQQILKMQAEGDAEGGWRIKGLVPASELVEVQKLMGDQLSEISGLKGQVKSLKATLESQTSRLKAAEGGLAEKIEELGHTKEALKVADAENGRLLTEGIELKDEVARLQAEVEELTALKSASEERERKDEGVIEGLHSRFVEMERQKDEAVKEIEKVLGAVISQVQDEKEKVGVELAESRNKVEEMEKWNSEVTETMQRMQAKIEALGELTQAKEAEIQALRQQLHAEEKEARAKEKQIVKLTADTQSLNALMLKAVESKQGMEEHLQAKGREVEGIKGSLRQAEAKVELLERELAWKDERLRAVEAEVQTQQLQVRRVEGRLVEVQQQMGVLQREKEDWAGQMRALEKEKASLDQELYVVTHEMLMKEREVQALQAAQGYGMESD